MHVWVLPDEGPVVEVQHAYAPLPCWQWCPHALCLIKAAAPSGQCFLWCCIALGATLSRRREGPASRTPSRKRRLCLRRHLLDHNTSLSRVPVTQFQVFAPHEMRVHIVVWLVVPRGCTRTFHYPTGLFSTFVWHVGLFVAGSMCFLKQVVRFLFQTTTFSLWETRSNASDTRKCCSYRQPMGSQTTPSLLAPCHSVARNGGHSGRQKFRINELSSTVYYQMATCPGFFVRWNKEAFFLQSLSRNVGQQSFTQCWIKLLSGFARFPHVGQAEAQMWSRNMSAVRRRQMLVWWRQLLRMFFGCATAVQFWSLAGWNWKEKREYAPATWPHKTSSNAQPIPRHVHAAMFVCSIRSSRLGNMLVDGRAQEVKPTMLHHVNVTKNMNREFATPTPTPTNRIGSFFVIQIGHEFWQQNDGVPVKTTRDLRQHWHQFALEDNMYFCSVTHRLIRFQSSPFGDQQDIVERVSVLICKGCSPPTIYTSREQVSERLVSRGALIVPWSCHSAATEECTLQVLNLCIPLSTHDRVVMIYSIKNALRQSLEELVNTVFPNAEKWLQKFYIKTMATVKKLWEQVCDELQHHNQEKLERRAHQQADHKAEHQWRRWPRRLRGVHALSLHALRICSTVVIVSHIAFLGSSREHFHISIHMAHPL